MVKSILGDSRGVSVRSRGIQNHSHGSTRNTIAGILVFDRVRKELLFSRANKGEVGYTNHDFFVLPVV